MRSGRDVSGRRGIGVFTGIAACPDTALNRRDSREVGTTDRPGRRSYRPEVSRPLNRPDIGNVRAAAVITRERGMCLASLRSMLAAGLATLFLPVLPGCYGVTPPQGGANTEFRPPR